MTDQDVRQPMSAKDARRQANADAAAAKARAKAQRPIWKKKRFIFPLLAVLLIIIIVATTGNDDDTASPTAVEPAAETADVEEAAGSADAETSEGQSDDAAVAEGYAIGEAIAMGRREDTFPRERLSEGNGYHVRW